MHKPPINRLKINVWVIQSFQLEPADGGTGGNETKSPAEDVNEGCSSYIRE